MASYPSALVTYTNPAGTSLLTSPDHAANHSSLNNEVIAIETTGGTTSGTSIFKNITVGKFAVSDNGGTATNYTFNAGTLGTPRSIGGTAGSITMQGGTANGVILGTPTIGTVTVPGTVAPLSFSAAIAPAIGTFNDGTAGTLTGTHRANAQAAQIYYSAMGTGAGNRTIGTPFNPTAAQTLLYAFKSSGSANGTLVWQSVFRFSQDLGTPAIGTGLSWNYYGWRYNAIDVKWDFVGQSKNVI